MNTFGFIGMGNMGYAMLKGALNSFSKEDIIFACPSSDRREKISEERRKLIQEMLNAELTEHLGYEKNEYIENNENSIKIDIYIKDNDTTYSMEKIYNMGVEKFINSFSLETFKITETQYHNKTGKIKYIKLEQQ